MKSTAKLGIIGGMGSRAGLLLFKKLIDASPAITDQDFIEVVLHSNTRVPDRTRAIVYGEASPLPYMMKSVDLLNHSEVDYILMACVTAHYYYSDLQQRAMAPILHPAEAAVEAYLSQFGYQKRLGVLCTTGSLKGRIFQSVCERHGIELVTLDSNEQESLFMKSLYMEGGLKSGIISDISLGLFRQSVDRLVDRGADVFIGGCSEVQVGLEKTTVSLPCIDAFDALVEKSVGLCYSQYEYAG